MAPQLPRRLTWEAHVNQLHSRQSRGLTASTVSDADAVAADVRADAADAGSPGGSVGFELGPPRRSCTGRHTSEAKHCRILAAVPGCSAGRTAASTQPRLGGRPTRKSSCRRPG